MPEPIELVIFDMDDVLGHLDLEKRLALLSVATGKPAAFLHERIWASDFETSAERGSYPTGEEYLAEFNRRTDCRLTREQWVHARRAAMTLSPDVLQIAREVGERRPIAVLTNNGSLLRESIGDILPEVAALFGERLHASYEFRARKPEPAVFEGLLARYSLWPSQALFIDDNPSYVEGALGVGMKAIRFTNATTLRNLLTEIGV